MTQGLKEGEPNGRDVYGNIIDHPHWQSPICPLFSNALDLFHLAGRAVEVGNDDQANFRI